MKVTPIQLPLSGEHLVTTFPVMKPETEDARWRQRINYWPGRALTEGALDLEQDGRAGRLAWRGRVVTPGIVSGLDAILEPPPAPQAALSRTGYFVHVFPGYGIRADGDDVTMPRPLRVRLEDIPVQYVRVSGPGHAAEAVPADATAANPINAGGFVYNVDTFKAAHDPWAAVLVLCPVEYDAFKRVDPKSPCELDLSQDAFSDERRLDACELRLCQLPASWETLAPLTDRNSPRFRNRLASVVSTAEMQGARRQQIRRLKNADGTFRWDTLIAQADVFPWELLGVPLALLSSEQVSTTVRAYFLDAAAIARPGGRARARTRPALQLATDANAASLNPPGAGGPIAWRARVDQFIEQLRRLPAQTAGDVEALASHFQFIPPIGFLPRPALALLTTADALALPPVANRPPDRAGVNHFFPGAYEVEAVPVALEDLDSALASSVALDPYDVSAAAAKESVRVLVPIPQHVFDPRLLVVEQEDPIFAQTIGRYVAARQDWRQRRDVVRATLQPFSDAIDGPKSAVPPPALDPDQVEPEPVETPDTIKAIGVTSALVSPSATAPPWELQVAFAQAHPVAADTVLFVLARVDAEQPPSGLQVRWQTASGVVPFTWTDLPDAPLEQRNQTGQPLPTPLWLRFEVSAVQLGISAASATGVVLHLGDGQMAIAGVGQLTGTGANRAQEFWWNAQDATKPVFTNGDWTAITGARLVTPFEDLYQPVFPDGRTQQARIADLDSALSPAGLTARADKMSVATSGIQHVLDELSSEADEADDFIDAHFTRAQTNLYRVRKLVLGETAAQRLLINPAIATIADQETATASAKELGSFLAAAKQRPVKKEDVTGVLNAPLDAPLRAPLDAARLNVNVAARKVANPNPVVIAESKGITGGSKSSSGVGRGSAGSAGSAGGGAGMSGRLDAVAAKVDFQGGGVLKEVLGERPETGPTIPPRGLSIGQRFVEPKATDYLSYARSSLTQMLEQLPTLRIPLVGQSVSSLDRKNTVSLVDLQRRALPQAGPPAKSTEDLRQAALTTLLTAPALQQDTDEAEVTLAAMDFIELQSAILRTIEATSNALRATIADGTTTLGILSDLRDLASGRVLTLEGKLAEARQDVSVARALRQEEQQRIAAVNDQRDTIIRDEVKFLAYVRPRTVDPTRRNVQYWTLEGFGEDQAVPVCLRQHDEPPAPLNTYLQLMRHAPARWFTALVPLITRLDTPDKLISLLATARSSALSFLSFDTATGVKGSADAVQFTVFGAQQVIGRLRQKTPALDIGDKRTKGWTDFQRDALQHASVGDLIDGTQASRGIGAAAAGELDQIGQIATCLHADFAAAQPMLRLAWVEQYSQFDQPAPLRDLTALPQFGLLDRTSRRHMQQLVDWLFGRITGDADAVSLFNDLIRLCLLLASHAPVNRIIGGHVPAPTPVRPGIRIPIRPLNPELVRVGMEFHVWQGSRAVAHGHVEDLRQEEVSARVERTDGKTMTLDASMRVQFLPAALGLMR